VALLGKLGVVKRLIGGFEIGAAVLLVAVEEEGIEPAVEVIVMRHVVTGASPQIELLQVAEQITHDADNRPVRCFRVLLAEKDAQHVGDRALLDNEAAVHKCFAELELGIEHDRALRLRGGEAHRDRRSASVAECM
jgi:hypothetical protein